MTESQHTRCLLAALRARLPQAVVVKLSDNYTAGLPDFFVSLDGVVTWFECKVSEPPYCSYTLGMSTKKIPALQWETLRLLQRGYLIVYTARGYGLAPIDKKRAEIRNLHLNLREFEPFVQWMIDIVKGTP